MADRGGGGGGGGGAGGAAAPAKNLPLNYICGQCNSLNRLSPRDIVRCKDCGYRIFYKVRPDRRASRGRGTGRARGRHTQAGARVRRFARTLASNHLAHTHF